MLRIPILCITYILHRFISKSWLFPSLKFVAVGIYLYRVVATSKRATCNYLIAERPCSTVHVDGVGKIIIIIFVQSHPEYLWTRSFNYTLICRQFSTENFEA